MIWFKHKIYSYLHIYMYNKIIYFSSVSTHCHSLISDYWEIKCDSSFRESIGYWKYMFSMLANVTYPHDVLQDAVFFLVNSGDFVDCFIKKSYTKRFSIFVFFIFYNFFSVFSKICFFGTMTCNKKKFRPQNWKSLCVTLCQIQCRCQNF